MSSAIITNILTLVFINFPCIPISPAGSPQQSESPYLELSDPEQLQLLIDFLSLFSTDYICTTIRVKSSAFLCYLFGVCIASGSSSKKRLLLHDSWLEMWIIILSLACDVEKNPGPRQVTGKQLALVS